MRILARLKPSLEVLHYLLEIQLGGKGLPQFLLSQVKSHDSDEGVHIDFKGAVGRPLHVNKEVRVQADGGGREIPKSRREK
eukprot:CAMPEP_0170502548 /NCGR_PEP_ID=MMETSP0208-20121228/41841_1 /TAXON_ID=197538 /ORGANISM="Strombidium inclinatum, Strain S3" /LENGTH=80 /DNA_ID=CAMNT_0010781683 /DNA_START=255 /DNA_END=494 /DNA_ORIENTATION=+